MHTCGICRTVVNCNTNIALKIFIIPSGSGVEATPYGKLCMLALTLMYSVCTRVWQCAWGDSTCMHAQDCSKH